MCVCTYECHMTKDMAGEKASNFKKKKNLKVKMIVIKLNLSPIRLNINALNPQKLKVLQIGGLGSQ